MRVLQIGSTGDDVRQWQAFLFGHNFKYVVVTGTFDDLTDKATEEFQRAVGLKSDGVVGPQTIAAAIVCGLAVVQPSAYPAHPSFECPGSKRVRELFGSFAYKVLPKGAILITDGWANANIIKVHIPQLAGIEGAPADCKVYFHHKGAKQLQSLFAAWERAGLLKYLKSWAGSFVPRMVRGSNSQLSNHAFGSAFDINAAWNGLGRTPAAGNQIGTVIPLVALANAHGFFWGGHYNNRRDGMHFELAVLDMFAKPVITDLRDDEIILHIPTISTIPAAQSGVLPSVVPESNELTDSNNPSNNNGLLISEQQTVENQPFLNSPNSLSKSESEMPLTQSNPPAADASNPSADTSLKVEDWKPWVLRWLKRVWTGFTGGNLTQGTALTFAALRDSEHWYIYAAIAAIIFLITLFFVLLASIGLGLVLWHNRKEIASYIRMSKESVLNPALKNLSLIFEKK